MTRNEKIVYLLTEIDVISEALASTPIEHPNRAAMQADLSTARDALRPLVMETFQPSYERLARSYIADQERAAGAVDIDDLKRPGD